MSLPQNPCATMMRRADTRRPVPAVHGTGAAHTDDLRTLLQARVAVPREAMVRVIQNPDTDIFHQGDHAEHVFLIEEGLVKYLRHAKSGRDLMVGLYTRGWVLGAAAAILERPHAGRATTVTRCMLWQTDASSFRELLREDATLAWALCRMITRDYYDRVVQASSLNSVRARRRLECLLYTLLTIQSSEASGPVRIRLPLSREELAEAIGVTREYVFHLLKELQQDGLVRLDKGWLVIERPSALSKSTDEQ